eukprot:3940725-Rhodomonas_salina.1
MAYAGARRLRREEVERQKCEQALADTQVCNQSQQHTQCHRYPGFSTVSVLLCAVLAYFIVAVCGTDIAYGQVKLVGAREEAKVTPPMLLRACYALSGTDTVTPPMLLRACYALS